jgi:3'(2'), 5'-bisphosphate nucleotidase
MGKYLTAELENAINLARKAGDVILEIYENDFEVVQKFSKDNFSEPVTIADTQSSELIVAGLREVFPFDGILSEEEKDNKANRLSSERVWIIDPIDGTQGFVEKAGDFAVQIGLAINGEPVLGVVFQPTNNRLYYSVKGEGCFIVEPKSPKRRLQVSDKQDFSDFTLAVSRSHRSSRMSRLNEVFGLTKEIPHGSVGLKVGLLAQQLADIYIHLSPRTKFWDTAAPQIILEEAGGKMTDLFGEDIKYDISDVQNYNGVLASNGVSHDAAVAKLRPLLAEFGRVKVLA